MEYKEILRQVTVDCRDDGEAFTCRERPERIKELLEGSDYRLWSEEPLFLLYAHKDFRPEQGAVLVSSHIDTVYGRNFARFDGSHWLGTWDNSATNAAVLQLMLDGGLPPSVVVAFTGDEEKNTSGAGMLMRWLAQERVAIRYVVISDVTNEGWGEAAFSIENDRGFDILAGFQIIHFVQSLELPCVFVHEAAPDESERYGAGVEGVCPPMPCLTLCLPVGGDMHSDKGCLLKEENVAQYQKALSGLLALDF